MFTESWIYFAIVMVVLGVAFQSNALIVLAALLLTVIPIAWAWNRVAFWRVSYDRALDETRVFVGETVDLRIRVGNLKFLPLAWIRIDDQMPSILQPTGKELAPSHIPLTGFLSQSATLGAFERARWQYRIPCTHRGFFTLGPAHLKSGDLFGLFEREWTHPHTDRLIVYPRLQPMEEWGLPAKDPLGDLRSGVPLYFDPSRPRGVREYHPEVAPKHIHWRATARTGALQVKLYDPTMTHEWVLFCNVATFAQPWQGVDSALLEQVISLAASIANYAAEHRLPVGMIANGTWPESDQRLRILPSRNPDQLRRILEALAAVTFFVTTPIENVLREESSRLAWGATLVTVTGIVTPELIAGLLRLRQAGRQIALISLDEQWTPPQDLEGILVRQARVTR
jgi:uncharacterized protein (DUF58 family)